MKIGHVEIEVQQYGDGRWGFDDYSAGPRKMVRLWNKQKAEQRATDVAVLLTNGRSDLLQIDAAELAEFRQWKSACNSSPSFADARSEFIELKSRRSSRHVISLERDLKLFEAFIGATIPIGTVTALDIQRFLSSRDVSERRKFNLRAEMIALFRWARRMSYLPDRTTEAEKVEPIEKLPGKPNVLSPDQLRVMLDNVLEAYLPWLAIGAFAGIRTEEIAPDRKSKKSPLMWEDFDWRHKVIIIREETSKTKHEREVPILPNLLQWLGPYRNCKGPVMGDCPRQPNDRETARLGKLIGGWKHNCLRDSFCSYRARMTQNVPQVSYEMGNSIAMVKRSYHRRQPIRTARIWFNIRPVKSANVLPFAQKKVSEKYQKSDFLQPLRASNKETLPR
jgi:integrase